MATQYKMLWQNKWLTAEATSITHMADLLGQAAEKLRLMTATGITLDPNAGCVGDDYATLVATDPIVAARFGLEAIEEEED